MPAPARDPRQAGSGSADTSHLFSTLHNAEIRSMFLPHGGDGKDVKSTTGSGGEKVVALSLGNLCLPPKGISASQNGPTSASILNPLSHYWYNNAVLCGGNPHGSSSGSNGNTSSASTVTSVLENGKVLVHTLMNDQDGPIVVGTIDAPPASPAWGTALNAAGGGDGGVGGGGDLSLPMEVTCASFIPAEIAIQQFWQVHHTLAPGSLMGSQPGSASTTARRSKSPNTSTATGGGGGKFSGGGGGQAGPPTSSVFQEPLLPNKDTTTSSADTTQLDRASSGDDTEVAAGPDGSCDYPPPPTLTVNDQDINLVSSVADALLGDDPISKSWRRRPDAREALEAHYSKHTGAEWRSLVVNQLWRGVVGTDSGEVFVFNGERYCFGFRCGSQKPPATRREVDQQQQKQQGDSAVPEYKKVAPSQSGSVSSAAIVSVHVVILPDESEGGGGGIMATKLASQEAGNVRRQNTATPTSSAASLAVPQQSSLNVGGNYSSDRTSNISMSTFQSDYQACTRVGIVTLQSDGNICVWKVKLPPANASSSRGGSKVAASAPAIDAVPVRLIQPSLLAKVRTLTVSHQYTIPMDLSNFGAVFSASAGQDLGSQFGWDDAFTPQQHPFVQELDTLLSSSSPADSGLNSNPSFNMASSSAAFTPAEYLPFISIIAFSGPGYDASVALRSGFGHVLDCDSKGDDVSIGDSRLRHTTAMAMEGDCVLVARERAVHLILFGDRSIRKLMTTRSRVRSLVIDRPIAIAGCQNGDIHVFASDSGTPLTTYSTYNGSPVKALSFNYQSMLLTVVDEESGEVELVSLPGILLRYGVLPPEKMLTRQGTVLRHTMALQETPSWKVSAKREASERRLLAKFSLANCVEQYLNFRTKLI